jgi:hypothetical protein
MKLSLAIAKYPAKHYVTAEAIAAIQDDSKRDRQIAANERLQEALDAYMNLVNLLHTTGDKVLDLSLLNTETMRTEAPDTTFWEVRLLIFVYNGGFVWMCAGFSASRGTGL